MIINHLYHSLLGVDHLDHLLHLLHGGHPLPGLGEPPVAVRDCLEENIWCGGAALQGLREPEVWLKQGRDC